MSSGCALHLEAYADLDDIRYYLAEGDSRLRVQNSRLARSR
jgi:hypothetical protein